MNNENKPIIQPAALGEGADEPNQKEYKKAKIEEIGYLLFNNIEDPAPATGKKKRPHLQRAGLGYPSSTKLRMKPLKKGNSVMITDGRYKGTYGIIIDHDPNMGSPIVKLSKIDESISVSESLCLLVTRRVYNLRTKDPNYNPNYNYQMSKKSPSGSIALEHRVEPHIDSEKNDKTSKQLPKERKIDHVQTGGNEDLQEVAIEDLGKTLLRQIGFSDEEIQAVDLRFERSLEGKNFASRFDAVLYIDFLRE